MCVFLINSSSMLLPFQNGPSAIFHGRSLISDQFVDDAHQSKQTSVPVLMFVLIFIWIPELLYIIISYFDIFHTVIQESK